MTKRKKYTVTNTLKSGDYEVISTDKISAFNSRVSIAMKKVNRDFQKKQKKSVERASKIVLNA